MDSLAIAFACPEYIEGFTRSLLAGLPAVFLSPPVIGLLGNFYLSADFRNGFALTN
jgi:hypothetical protein